MMRVFRLPRDIVRRLLYIQSVVSANAGVKVPMSTIVREVLLKGLQKVEENEYRGPNPDPVPR